MYEVLGPIPSHEGKRRKEGREEEEDEEEREILSQAWWLTPEFPVPGRIAMNSQPGLHSEFWASLLQTLGQQTSAIVFIAVIQALGRQRGSRLSSTNSKFKASLDYIRGSGMESVVREAGLTKNKTLKTLTT